VVLMWPFSRARAERQQDVLQLAELVLVKKLEAEAKLEESKANALLASLERELKIKEKQLEHHEKISAERRERARLQRQDGVRRFGPVRRAVAASGCAACSDPGSPHLTAAEIIAHRQHGNAAN
jgi:hypothetical protein